MLWLAAGGNDNDDHHGGLVLFIGGGGGGKSDRNNECLFSCRHLNSLKPSELSRVDTTTEPNRSNQIKYNKKTIVTMCSNWSQ